MPPWVLNQIKPRRKSVLLSSNVLAPCFDTLKSGSETALVQPEQEAAQTEQPAPLSLLRRRLRIRLGEMVSV